MKAVTDTQYYDDIANAINYSKDDTETYTPSQLASESQTLAENYRGAVSEIEEDNDYFNDIGEAIVAKDGGEIPDKSEMAGRIDNIIVAPVPVQNPALILWDWEGTKLAEYSREDALALTELPAPDTLPPYATADHDLLVFQSWNCSLANIKTWIQNHEGETRDVDAIYTTTDGVDHDFWNSPRLGTEWTISMRKMGTERIGSIGNDWFKGYRSLTRINIPYGATVIGSRAFQYCDSLTQINVPNSVTNIGDAAFADCPSLKRINIPDSVTNISYSSFYRCLSLKRINIPDSVTSIGSSAFQECHSLTQINVPNSVTNIGDAAFRYCYSLTQINVPNSVTNIGGNTFQGDRALCDILNESKSALSNTNAFDSLPSNYRIYVPRADLSWHETETNWSTIYAQGHIVAIEDYIAYLESIGFNVDAYKEAA